MSKIRPFDCGSQYNDWTSSNCVNCTKFSENGGTCEIETALLDAYCQMGEVLPSIATRMGYVEGPPFRYVWPCAEGVATPERLAELDRRRSKSAK